MEINNRRQRRAFAIFIFYFSSSPLFLTPGTFFHSRSSTRPSEKAVPRSRILMEFSKPIVILFFVLLLLFFLFQTAIIQALISNTFVLSRYLYEKSVEIKRRGERLAFFIHDWPHGWEKINASSKWRIHRLPPPSPPPFFHLSRLLYNRNLFICFTESKEFKVETYSSR